MGREQRPQLFHSEQERQEAFKRVRITSVMDQIARRARFFGDTVALVPLSLDEASLYAAAISDYKAYAEYPRVLSIDWPGLRSTRT